MTPPPPPAPLPPPHNLDAEKALLGGLLLDGEAAGDAVAAVRALVRPGDFYSTSHRLLFEAMLALDDRGEPPAAPLVLAECERRGTLAEVGGRERLSELVASAGSAANAESYARQVHERAAAREVLRLTLDVSSRARDGGAAGDLVEDLERGVLALSETARPARVASGPDLGADLQREWDAPPEGPAGVATGLADLDAVTGGLRPGQLVVVAGRTSMGKTTLALNFVRRVALERRRPVLVFSLEMSRIELARNLAAAVTGVETTRMHDPRRLRREDLRVLAHARAALDQAPLHVCDEPHLTLPALRSVARRHRLRHGVELVVVDYLQLMPTGGLEGLTRGATREQQVSALSRGLKMLARELEVPVVALAQLNRGPEARDDHRPRLSDLRESGGIEADADLVLLLYRADYYATTDAERAVARGVLEVCVAKNRNGPQDTVRLAYRAECSFLGDLAAEHLRGEGSAS